MVGLNIPESYKYISAFLTMRCNLDCSFCLNAFSKEFNRKGFEEISGKEWVEGLNKINSRKGVPITLSGGEVFLHPDFVYILNNIKPELEIDILTNLQWGKKGIEKFIQEVNPQRLKRDSLYPSIRVSYHPEEMGNGEKLAENVRTLKDAGFDIGIYSVQYPSSKQLEAITKMQFLCINKEVEFRVKDYTGVYSGIDDNGREFSITYGDYSKYPGAAFNRERKSCECRTSELLIGPNGNGYKCHRDVFSGENPIGNINNPNFEIEDKFRFCDKYGECHPCDVKVKTNHQQELGHTSVEIIKVK